VVLRLTELAGYTDWALIVSGRSDRHVEGLTGAILEGLLHDGRRPLGTDGLSEHAWDLLDFDDFLVHVFHHPVRQFYDLESMWNDAPRVRLELPPEVMDTSDFAPGRAPGAAAWRGSEEFGGFEDEFADEDEELFGATE
jgi:ribosome-associated protein